MTTAYVERIRDLEVGHLGRMWVMMRVPHIRDGTVVGFDVSTAVSHMTTWSRPGTVVGVRHTAKGALHSVTVREEFDGANIRFTPDGVGELRGRAALRYTTRLAQAQSLEFAGLPATVFKFDSSLKCDLVFDLNPDKVWVRYLYGSVPVRER